MHFTIDIAEDWLDVLDALIAQVAAQSASSPEEALEKTLFAQLNEQRTNTGKGDV